jgi:hypothetical protein
MTRNCSSMQVPGPLFRKDPHAALCTTMSARVSICTVPNTPHIQYPRSELRCLEYFETSFLVSVTTVMSQRPGKVFTTFFRIDYFITCALQYI